MLKSPLTKYLFFSYLTVVVVVSVIPTGSSVDTALNDTYVLDLLRLDYLMHALVYIPFVSLWRMGWPGRSWWMVVGGGLIFAACCEGIQFWLSYRAFNVNDLFGNMTGVVLGAIVAKFITK